MCSQHRKMHENGGRMPRRVPKAELPKHAFDVKNVILLDSTECVICFEHMNQEDMVLTNCGHVYHRNCLERWQRHNPECPQCKRKTNALRTTGQRLNLALRLLQQAVQLIGHQRDRSYTGRHGLCNRVHARGGERARP